MSFDAASFRPKHFLWAFADGVATVTLNRPERKNPLTFESYAELRDTFRALTDAKEVKVVVIRGEGGNFCSGGDVHEIIGPLTKMDDGGLLEFTTMTGDLVKAIRACPQPIIAAVEGVCAGAGAILAMASDIRFATPKREDRLPVHPRRPFGRRHGRLRHPAADHRPRPRGGIAVHRPVDERRGRPRLGLLEPLSSTTCWQKRMPLRCDLAQRTDLRPCHDQAAARRRMARVDRRGDRRWRPKRRPCA